MDVSLVNARFLRPLDEELLSSFRGTVITLEDNVLIGGLGDCVARFYRKRGYQTRVIGFGFSDCFLPHGEPSELMEDFGLNFENILAAVREAYARR